MNKKKAIKILEEQKQKVLNSNIKNNKQLVIQTCSIIIEFFGKESPEFHYINKFSFDIDFHKNVPDENKQRHLKHRENEFIEFLNNCKQTLKNKDINKPEKNNWFSHKTNEFIIGSIISIFMTGATAGYWIRDIELFSILFRKEKTELPLTSQTEFLPILTSDKTDSTKLNDSTNNKKLTIKERIK